MSLETKQSALRLFDGFRTEFPHLVMQFDPADPEGMSFKVPQQVGLTFEVNLNLQNDDELHLCAGSFWCSWFPSSKPDVIQAFHDAVSGVLAGRNQIIEYLRWGRTVGADLQAPHGGGWKTIARSRCGLLPMSWFSDRRILINREAC